MITAEQLRAARAMLRWDQATIAEKTGLSVPTIKRMEGGAGPVRGTYESVAAIQAALEAAGVEFLGGTGVQLKPEASE